MHCANAEEICNPRTEPCKKFLSDPAVIIPTCEIVAKELSLKSIADGVKAKLNLFCYENCEFGKEIINNIDNPDPKKSNSTSESAFKSDCARKECVDKIINYYEHVLDHLTFIFEYTKLIDDEIFLKTDRKIYEEKKS